MTDPSRSAPRSPRSPVTAPIERREFLRLGLGGAALLVGCGDDLAAAAGDTSSTDATTSGSTTTADVPTTTGDTAGDPTTGDLTTTGDATTTTTTAT